MADGERGEYPPRRTERNSYGIATGESEGFSKAPAGAIFIRDKIPQVYMGGAKLPAVREGAPDEILAVMRDLEARPRFTQWKLAHPGHQLAYLFVDFKPSQEMVWQVGYFREGMITSFVLTAKLEIAEEQESAMDAEDLQALDLSRVRVGLTRALQHAQESSAAKKPFMAFQTLAILQCIQGVQLWNITLFAKELVLLNLKLDAGNGAVLREEFSSLFDLARPSAKDR